MCVIFVSKVWVHGQSVCWKDVASMHSIYRCFLSLACGFAAAMVTCVDLLKPPLDNISVVKILMFIYKNYDDDDDEDIIESNCIGL